MGREHPVDRVESMDAIMRWLRKVGGSEGESSQYSLHKLFRPKQGLERRCQAALSEAAILCTAQVQQRFVVTWAAEMLSWHFSSDILKLGMLVSCTFRHKSEKHQCSAQKDMGHCTASDR